MLTTLMVFRQQRIPPIDLAALIGLLDVYPDTHTSMMPFEHMILNNTVENLMLDAPISL